MSRGSAGLRAGAGGGDLISTGAAGAGRAGAASAGLLGIGAGAATGRGDGTLRAGVGDGWAGAGIAGFTTSTGGWLGLGGYRRGLGLGGTGQGQRRLEGLVEPALGLPALGVPLPSSPKGSLCRDPCSDPVPLLEPALVGSRAWPLRCHWVGSGCECGWPRRR
ncbi:hypothetical protein [Cyanobium sp. ULC082]